MKVFTGLDWKSVNEKIYISTTEPVHALIGDLWVNQSSGNQLMANTGINQWILVGGSGSGSVITSSDTAPISPNIDELWFDTINTEMMIYYNDGNSSQWVNANASSSTMTVGGSTTNRPVSPELYQQYFDTTLNYPIIWNGSNWVNFMGGNV